MYKKDLFDFLSSQIWLQIIKSQCFNVAQNHFKQNLKQINLIFIYPRQKRSKGKPTIFTPYFFKCRYHWGTRKQT